MQSNNYNYTLFIIVPHFPLCFPVLRERDQTNIFFIFPYCSLDMGPCAEKLQSVQLFLSAHAQI